MTQNIEVGDNVKSNSQPFLNGGLAMNVWEVSGNTAICDIFDGIESVHKQIELPISDLTIIIKTSGGFRNAGEAL